MAANTGSPISRQRVVGLLHHLGGDADAIAQTLQRHGITGRPDSAAQCPIAHYLSARTRHAEGTSRRRCGLSASHVWRFVPDCSPRHACYT